MKQQRNFDKINRVRNLLNEEDVQTMLDPSSSQDDRMAALANREAARRLAPYSSRERRDTFNGMTNLLPSDRDSFHDEMMSQPTSAHGYPTSPGSYEQYNTYEVETRPQAYMNTHNVTNLGYATELGDRARKMDQILRVQDVLRQNLDRKSLDYVTSVKSALGRQIASGMVNPMTAFQRYAISNAGTYTEEQLVLIGLDMKVLSEKYDSVGGMHVVTMPFKAPNTPEEIIYNLKGMDGVSGKEAHKRQIGHYDAQAEDLKRRMPQKQVPPARHDSEDAGLKYYRSGDQKSRRSMQNPRRGDDFIRHSRIKAALGESADKVIVFPSKQKPQPGPTLKQQASFKSRMAEQAEQQTIAKVKKLKEDALQQIKLLESKHAWVREAAHKELIAIRNNLKHLIAMNETRKAEVQEAKANANYVEYYAEGLSRYCDSRHRDQVVAEDSYNRHISLLEEAKQLLNKTTMNSQNNWDGHHNPFRK